MIIYSVYKELRKTKEHLPYKQRIGGIECGKWSYYALCWVVCRNSDILHLLAQADPPYQAKWGNFVIISSFYLIFYTLFAGFPAALDGDNGFRGNYILRDSKHLLHLHTFWSFFLKIHQVFQLLYPLLHSSYNPISFIHWQIYLFFL